MKILTTQLTGLLQRTAEREALAVEETARLLAQASVGEGRIILAPFGELETVALRALQGVERLDNAVRYEEGMELSEVDRIFLLTDDPTNKEALRLARYLFDEFIPFAVMGNPTIEEAQTLGELAYTYVGIDVQRGILPSMTTGERIVQPTSIVALFLFEAILMTYNELLAGDDEQPASPFV